MNEYKIKEKSILGLKNFGMGMVFPKLLHILFHLLMVLLHLSSSENLNL